MTNGAAAPAGAATGAESEAWWPSPFGAGDQLGAWGYAGLAALGLALTGISWVMVPLSAAALALGLWLGRRQHAMARRERAVAKDRPTVTRRAEAAV